VKAKSPRRSGRNAQTMASSSEVDAGSREERVKTKNRASVLVHQNRKSSSRRKAIAPNPDDKHSRRKRDVRPLRVKTGKAQREHMFSAVHPIADIAHRSLHVRFVPIPEVAFTVGLLPSSFQKAARGGGDTATCDADQGSSTILPPSPSAPYPSQASLSRPLRFGPLR
jgi:hypothetical protein